MGFTDFLKLVNDMTNAIIFDFLPKKHEVGEIDLLYRMMRDYPSRPKKGLRAGICLLSSKAFSGDYTKALITASAIELFQSWILIHDDIEDGSELRRGSPTLHRLYGIPLALNAGDALHVKMWELLMKNRAVLGYEGAMRIFDEFIEMVNRTTEGQHMELGWIAENRWDLGEEDYIRMTELKSAYYTCVAPMRMGSFIGGASDDRLDLMKEMGLKLGVAFQIRDDILNLIAGEEYGKEGKGDILEGKRTLMVMKLLEVSEGRERERLVEALSKPREEKTKEDVEFVYSRMIRYGVIEYARRRAVELYEDAMGAFDEAFDGVSDRGAKGDLRDLFRFLVERRW